MFNQDVLSSAKIIDYPLINFPNLFEAGPEIPIEVAFMDFEEWEPTFDGQIKHTPPIPTSVSKSLNIFSNEAISDKMVDFASAMYGAPLEINGFGFQRYDVGDFLGAHSDLPSYRATMVLYLSPNWRPSWGGVLEFSYNKGPWGAVSVPVLGSASFLITHPAWEHRVTKINEKARIPRLSAIIRFREKRLEKEESTP